MESNKDYKHKKNDDLPPENPNKKKETKLVESELINKVNIFGREYILLY